MIFYWIIGEILVGVVLGYALGRFAVAAGVIIIVLGVAPMVALFFYESFAPTTGDTSSAGLLSTVIIFVVTPVGITTLFTAYFRD